MVGTVTVPTEIVAQRLRDADDFFRVGKEEIRQGTEDSDDMRTRQGFEKLFHALLNAYVARVYVYREFYFYPASHKALLEGLEIAELRGEATFYGEMLEIFHNRLYHQGETNLFGLAKLYVGRIELEIATARDWIAEVS